MTPELPRLEAEVKSIIRFPNPETKNWSGFNPSICRGGDGRLGMLVRSSNYVFDSNTKTVVLVEGGIILNKLFFCYINEETLEPEDIREITEIRSPMPLRRGVEDARLYWRKGGWEFTGVVLESHTPLARLWTFSLDLETNSADFIEILNAPDPKKIEKNWMMPADRPSPYFDFLYNSKSVYKDGEILPIDGAPDGQEWLRGGSQLLWDGDGYISINHKVKQVSKYVYNVNTFGMEYRHVRNYKHVFCKHDEHGKLIAMSDEFVFKEIGIEYAAGMAVVGDNYIISYGVWDVASAIAVIPIERVRSMLRPAAASGSV